MLMMIIAAMGDRSWVSEKCHMHFCNDVAKDGNGDACVKAASIVLPFIETVLPSQGTLENSMKKLEFER